MADRYRLVCEHTVPDDMKYVWYRVEDTEWGEAVRMELVGAHYEVEFMQTLVDKANAQAARENADAE